MTDYTKTVNFAAKDALSSGDANKIAKGAEIDVEYNNIATAVATKADTASPTFTGNVIMPAGNAAAEAIQAQQIQTGELAYAADAEASDTYVIALTPSIIAYTAGMVIAFKANTKNTGPATINVNGAGAKAIEKVKGQALNSGDIQAAQFVILQYDGTAFQMVTQVPDRWTANYAADTASDDDYLVALTPTAQEYYTGMLVAFKATTKSTGAVTLDVDSLGAKAILKRNNLPVENDDIEAGQLVIVQYDGTQFQMQSQVATRPEIIVQRASTQTGAVASNASGAGDDDTIPQNTEGSEYMTLALTPKNTNNILQIDVICILACNEIKPLYTALFKDAIANALTVVVEQADTVDKLYALTLRHTITAGTTNAITFKVRAGRLGTTGTVTFNGVLGLRKLGGVLASGITITEYKP